MASVRQILAIIACLLLTAAPVSAHPGRTDSSGGHTCRTNCGDWGLNYNEYHYHNRGGTGGSNIELIAPTSTPKPTLIPTIRPSATPTLIHSPKPTETSQKISEPTTSPENSSSDSNESGAFGSLITTSILPAGGYWIYKKLKKRSNTK